MKVEYDSELGFYDGLTKGNTYEVIGENEAQYIVNNDLGATSTINKKKFIVIEE